MDTHRIFPHGKPETFADGLWQVKGTLPFPLERKMVVHKLPDGTLLLHSVVAMDDDGMKALEAIGKPSVLVVPHPMHTLDVTFYAKRYPDLKIVAPADVAQKLGDKVKVDATPEEALPALGITPHTVPGMKYTEVVLEVPVGDGRALLFTDLVGRAEKARPGFMMKVLGPPKGSGVPRIVKFRQLADKKKVRAFLEEMAATPNLRVVMGSHSDPIVGDAAAFLKDAAAGC